MICLWTQMQDAASCLGASAVLAHRTHSAGLGGKNDFHAFPCLAQADTLLPLRTGRLLLVPINGKMSEIEAFACFGPPAAVRHGGADQFDPSLMTPCQQFGVHIPCIHHLLLRLDPCFHSLLLNGGGNSAVLAPSHGGLPLFDQVRRHWFSLLHVHCLTGA